MGPLGTAIYNQIFPMASFQFMTADKFSSSPLLSWSLWDLVSLLLSGLVERFGCMKEYWQSAWTCYFCGGKAALGVRKLLLSALVLDVLVLGD